MNREEFSNAARMLCSVGNVSFPEDAREDVPSALFPLSIVKRLPVDGGDGLLSMKSDDGDIVLRLHYPNTLDLYIREQDVAEEDAPVHYKDKKGKLALYSKSAAITLLLNLALWIYDKRAKYKLSCKEKSFEFTQFMKSNFSHLYTEHDTINKIFSAPNSFMVFLYRDQTYFLVMNDAATLASLNRQVEEIKGSMSKPVGKKPKKRKIFGRNVAVNIDPEDGQAGKEAQARLEKSLEALLAHFEAEIARKELRKEIAASVVDDCYQQSDERPCESAYKAFEKTMRLQRIDVFPDGFMLIYNIPTDSDEQLYVQLSGSYAIEEITIN